MKFKTKSLDLSASLSFIKHYLDSHNVSIELFNSKKDLDAMQASFNKKRKGLLYITKKGGVFQTKKQKKNTIMGKEVKTIEEQIAILKTRGMHFDNEEKAKEILRDVGYYRLGFYWFYFQENSKNHIFAENTQFSTIMDLYYLDMDFRHLLIKVLSRIEINLRTQIIYIVSSSYKDKPVWFADPKIMKKEFIRKLPKYYTESFKQQNKVISRHHKKYTNDKYAPAWKTLEFMTLGSIYKIFKALKDNVIKEEIADYYGIKNIEIFDNYFRAIVYIRNICSHTRVLFDLNTYFPIKSSKVCPIAQEERNSLNAIIKVIHYFLSVISKNRAEDLRKSIKSLVSNYIENEAITKIVREKMKISLQD
ncbi:Abi family protein [Capnocytophaga genosp. AHN8471]|uniref:Abi family protein n=1 Tax=Capnocytophaga genosp. AHN8471 TaxID=327574 RepID=UPI001EE3E8D0|nr:Abi family protein [Capnocytophaga genosp. AHN8471]